MPYPPPKKRISDIVAGFILAAIFGVCYLIYKFIEWIFN